MRTGQALESRQAAGAAHGHSYLEWSELCESVRLMPAEIIIRPAGPRHRADILRIVREVVEDGSTYVFAQDTPDSVLTDFFLDNAEHAFVAMRGDEVVGCYFIRRNQPGRGAHVANAAYVVSRAAAGKGVGHAMGVHSLEEARRLAFTAMQFNFVVSTNERAVALWRRLGFAEVGRLPRVFQHPTLGLVDALVMHRFL
jgi:GNAT superfamily N-acetyltransferase